MFRSISSLLLLSSLYATVHSQSANSFIQSNGSVPARTIDKQLIDPWKIVSGLRTPLWINTPDSGRYEIYSGGGDKQLVLQIPAAGGQSKAGTTAGIAFGPSNSEFIIPHSSTTLLLGGMTMAPASFCADLLSGNFNVGKINAVGLNTIAFKGQSQNDPGQSL